MEGFCHLLYCTLRVFILEIGKITLSSSAGWACLGLVPEEPGPSGEIAGQRELLSRLRAAVEAKDAENAVLRAELDAER